MAKFLIVHPSSDAEGVLDNADIVEETGLPQSICELADGDYRIARMSYNPNEIIIDSTLITADNQSDILGSPVPTLTTIERMTLLGVGSGLIYGPLIGAGSVLTYTADAPPTDIEVEGLFIATASGSDIWLWRLYYDNSNYIGLQQNPNNTIGLRNNNAGSPTAIGDFITPGEMYKVKVTGSTTTGISITINDGEPITHAANMVATLTTMSVGSYYMDGLFGPETPIYGFKTDIAGVPGYNWSVIRKWAPGILFWGAVGMTWGLSVMNWA